MRTHYSGTCSWQARTFINMTKIYIASDHAGYALKEYLVKRLTDDGFDVGDLGPRELDPSDDYPPYMSALASAVLGEECAWGIGIGHSGQGEAMALNRERGIRAAVYYGGSDQVLRLSREHNNANVLSLGAGFLSEPEAYVAFKKWYATPFSGEERHERRINALG